MQRAIVSASTSGVCIQATHRQGKTVTSPVVALPRALVASHNHSGAKLSRPDVRALAAPQTKREVMADKWWEKDSAPNMKDVHNIQELVDELAHAGEKLVIVEFYAPWCGACKALFPKLCKMMTERQNDIQFLKVSLEDNKDMCKTMGVKVLPFFHLYRGALGKVDQFSCTVSKIQRMRDAIEEHTSEFCNLDEVAGVAEFPEVKPRVSTGSSCSSSGGADDKVTKLAWN